MVELPREKERMLLGVSRMRGVSGSQMMPRLLPILVDYFSQLSTTTSNLQALEQVMEGVQSCVIQSLNAVLLQPYTVEESCFHNFDSKIHPPLSLTSHLAALIINSLE